MEGLLRFSAPRAVWILRDGKLLRLSSPAAVWILPEASTAQVTEPKHEARLSDVLTNAGLQMLDRKGTLLCRTCHTSWKADYRQPLYLWVYCPNRCNVG